MFIVKTFLKKAKAEQICKVTVYVFFRHRITCFRQKPQLGRKKTFLTKGSKKVPQETQKKILHKTAKKSDNCVCCKNKRDTWTLKSYKQTRC